MTRLCVCSCIVVQGVPESPTIWKTSYNPIEVFMNPFVFDYRLNVHFTNNQCKIIYCEIKTQFYKIFTVEEKSTIHKGANTSGDKTEKKKSIDSLIYNILIYYQNY